MFLERLPRYFFRVSAFFLSVMQSQARMSGLVWALCALAYLTTLAGPLTASVNDADRHPHAESSRFVYEARVGLLEAGELDFSFSRSQKEYGFLGRFLTAKGMSEYYT